MTNIIIPITQEAMLDFVFVACQLPSSKVFVGICKDIFEKNKPKKMKNVEWVVFENATKKEEMINSIQEKLEMGSLIICRKAITIEELFEFEKSEKTIAVCKTKRNSISKFFHKIYQKIILHIFGFEYFDGDVSVVKIDEKLYSIFKNAENLSYITRINKWIGVDVQSILISQKPAVKEYNKLNLISMLAIWTFVLIALISSFGVYLALADPSFLAVFAFIAVIFISIVAVFLSYAIFNMNILVGKRIFGKGKILKGEEK